MNKSSNVHKPIVRLETNVLYSCLSEASKAMGKYPGYVSERFRLGKPCIDSEGNVWTFKELASDTVPLRRITSRCVIDEISNRVFDSPTQASLAIGRSTDYINLAIKKKTTIRDVNGRELHFHFVD